MPARTPSSAYTQPRLPEGAPKARITIGSGSPSEKSWNLRRPVTMIGSRRTAHILLRHPEVSKAHCVVVNTGRHVIASDLNSRTGTSASGQAMTLSELHDGDVLRIGPVDVEVAIQAGEAADDADPGQMPLSAALRRRDGADQWELSRAVVLVGRKQGCDVLLDHSDVSLAHAVLCHVDGELAVFDLGSRTGTWLNGEQVHYAVVHANDVLRVGPLELDVVSDALTPRAEQADGELPAAEPEGGEVEPTHLPAALGSTEPTDISEPIEDETVPADWDGGNADDLVQPDAVADTSAINLQAGSGQNAEAFVSDLEQSLSAFQQNLTQSAQRLTEWQARLEARAADLDRSEQELAGRRGELEECEGKAAEQELALATRTLEVERATSELDQAREAQEQGRRALEEAEEGLSRREGELGERESAVSDREAQISEQEQSLTDQQEALQTAQAELAQKQADLAEEVDQARQRHAEQEQALASAEEALKAKEEALEATSTEVEGRRQEVEAYAAEVETYANQIEAEAAKFKADAEAMAETRQQLDDRSQQLEDRSAELDEQEQEVEQQHDVLAGERARTESELAAVRKQAALIQKAQAALAQANAVFEGGLVPPAVAEGHASAEVDQAPAPEAPASEEPIAEPLAEPEPGDEVDEVETVPAPSEPEPIVEDVSPESPEPSSPDADAQPNEVALEAVAPDEPPEDAAEEVSTPIEEEPPAETPARSVLEDLDPETVEELRMLRRLGAKGSDEVLLAQLEAKRKGGKAGHDGAQNGDDGSKKRWWGR